MSFSLAQRLAPLLGMLVLAIPGWVQACAVCSPGDDLSRGAFRISTVFMSALPMLLVGGFAWWLYRKAKQSRRTEEVRVEVRPTEREISS